MKQPGLLPNTLRLDEFMSTDWRRAEHDDAGSENVRYLNRREARLIVLHFDHAAERLVVDVRPGPAPVAGRPTPRASRRRSTRATKSRGSPDDDADGDADPAVAPPRAAKGRP